MQGGVIYKEVYINYLLCQPVIIIIVLIIITTRSHGYNNNGSPRRPARPCFTAYRVPRKVLTRETRVAAMGLKRSLEGFLKSSFNRDFLDDKWSSRGCDARKVKSTMVVFTVHVQDGKTILSPPQSLVNTRTISKNIYKYIKKI